jgi:hypothetical protein
MKPKINKTPFDKNDIGACTSLGYRRQAIFLREIA